MQTTLTDPLGNATQRLTDKVGRLQTLQYLNEMTKVTPDVLFTYDKGGQRQQMSEWTGGTSPIRITNYSYDQAYRLNQVSFDLNGDGSNVQTVGYQYDAGGLRTQLTLPGSLSVNYTYNQRGQLIGLTDWASQQTQYAYDQADRLTAARASNGLLSQYQYDPAGRLRLLRHSKDSQTLAHFAYTVDARSNRTQTFEAVAQAVTGTMTYAYNDPAVNLYLGTWTPVTSYQTTTNFSAGLQLAFFGRSATLTMGQGSDHSIYDVYVDGDLWQSVDGYASSTASVDLTISLTGDGPHTLDIRNRPERNLQSSGYQLRFKKLQVTGTFADLQTIRYSYDAISRLQDAKYYNGINTALLDANLPQRYQYSYDTAGNRMQQIATVAGTATTTNYIYDAANRLQSDGSHSYTFDAAGHMTSDSIHSLTWDRANRLLSYNGSSYDYDGLGRRIQQTVGATVTQYTLDTNVGLATVWASAVGTATTRYVHGPIGLQQIQDSASSWHWLVKDASGSVRSILDSTLAVQESRLYEPYGKPYSATGTSQADFGFTGEQTDSNGLVYLRARYYNAAIGQFFSLDPFEGVFCTLMSLNRYMYVQGGPINWIDPSGLDRKTSECGNRDCFDLENEMFNVYNRFKGLAQRFNEMFLDDCRQYERDVLHQPFMRPFVKASCYEEKVEGTTWQNHQGNFDDEQRSLTQWMNCYETRKFYPSRGASPETCDKTRPTYTAALAWKALKSSNFKPERWHGTPAPTAIPKPIPFIVPKVLEPTPAYQPKPISIPTVNPSNHSVLSEWSSQSNSTGLPAFLCVPCIEKAVENTIRSIESLAAELLLFALVIGIAIVLV